VAVSFAGAGTVAVAMVRPRAADAPGIAVVPLPAAFTDLAPTPE
jgi:hypothetical protein